MAGRLHGKGRRAAGGVPLPPLLGPGGLAGRSSRLPAPTLPHCPPPPNKQVRTFEAHSDYIRSIAVHPSLPYLLTSSDDMLIKLWDWDKAWACVQVFEGHSHYVMQVGLAVGWGGGETIG
jgi:WD40 repeat protein